MSGRAGVPATLFDRLLAAGREAHAMRQHEVAFHALSAALHAADDAGNAAQLQQVGEEARAEIAWIDAHDPAQRLSTSSAARHGHPGVFALLSREADMHVTALQRSVRREAP